MKQQTNLKNHIRERVRCAFRELQLILVQSSVCILALLIVWLLRWSGGELFDQVSALFRKAMLENTLVSAVTLPLQEKTVSAMSGNTTSSVFAPFEGGVITSYYGERDGSWHDGVDIAKEEGSALYAMLDGLVTVAEYDSSGYGYYMVVMCDDRQKYLYAHCRELFVEAGDTVKAGDILASVGNTGRSSGSHLHVEWICDGRTQDPLLILPSETYV